MNKQELINSLKERNFPEKIIKAFEVVNREKYIPKEIKGESYEDTALPIGYRQTISQPYTIAFMLDLLEVKGGQKILEVGSGSGYVLELLAQLNKKGTIFGVERVKELAESSSRVLRQYSNITVKQGDGSKGLKNEEPFDRILVSAAAASIPEKLVEQLKINGILVVPVKNSIVVVKKSALKNKIEEYPGFVFVPLIENEE